MSADFDVAVIGSGFAGSLMAMIVRRLGRSIVLLERGRHPRFAIGESSTPLANLLLEEVARRYDLPRLMPLAKWGTWQRAYPEIGCGLKRGFTFYHHQWDQRFSADPERRDQLLVAASPRNEIGDTHWYRPDFDHFLVREAQALGVEYLDQFRLAAINPGEDGVHLEGERGGEGLKLRARFVIDASGPRGAVHRALNLPEIPFQNLPPTQALFTHFTGVRRLSEMGLNQGDDTPPYPIDDAAVHHVFEGGWIWVLRFNNRVTSAGVAATDALSAQLRLSEGAPAWERLLKRLPTVREQMQTADAMLPFTHIPRLSFFSGVATGPRWAMLPSAAGFVDPLLSTGFPLTFLGIIRLARIFECQWNRPGFDEALNDYGRLTLAELDATEQLIGALYASMGQSELFSALTLLYFAAASYSETVRRLERPELADSFLLQDNPRFGPATRTQCRRILDASRNGNLRALGMENVITEIGRAIEPFDVAGLTDRTRRNWYPVNVGDVFKACPKLGVSEDRMGEMLRRCGALTG